MKFGLLKLTALILPLLFNSSAWATNWCEDADVEGCYTYDTNSDDESANARDGTLQANTVHATDNPVGTANSNADSDFSAGHNTFDGAGDYITFNWVALSDYVSVVAYVRNDSDGGSSHYEYIGTMNNASSQYNWMLRFDEGENDIEFVWQASNCSTWATMDSANEVTFSASTWVHYAATKAFGSQNNDEIYINGVAKKVASSNNDTCVTGTFTGGQGWDLGGDVSQFAVFNMILTSSDVSDIMDNGLLQAVAGPTVSDKVFSDFYGEDIYIN